MHPCSNHQFEQDLDTSEYIDAESSKWVVDDLNFKVFNDSEFKQKLFGKIIYLIGDSHMRTAYSTIVGVLAGFDYKWNDDNKCRNNMDWLFKKSCRKVIQINNWIYEDKGSTKIVLVTVWDHKSFSNAMKTLQYRNFYL